jgi:hypothetical protein
MDLRFILLAFVTGLGIGGASVGVIMNKKFDKDAEDLVYQRDQAEKELIKSEEIIDGYRQRVKDFNVDLNVDPFKAAKAVENAYQSALGQMRTFAPRGSVNSEKEGEDEEDEDDPDANEPDPSEEDPGEIDFDGLDFEKTVAGIVDGAEQKAWDLAQKQPIHNITAEEYFTGNPDWAKIGVSYYPATQMFLDINDVELENPDEVVGKGLLFFGLNSGDKDVVYIRNDTLQTDIEVCRVEE